MTKTVCAIDDDECLGSVLPDYLVDTPLCEFHIRALSEIGEDGFREWYSIELEDFARNR